MENPSFDPMRSLARSSAFALLIATGPLAHSPAQAASPSEAAAPQPRKFDANADWARRSQAPGVIVAVGFDDIEEWAKASFDRDQCNPNYQVRTRLVAKAGCRNNAWDSTVRASGAGSVRFDILPRTGQGAGGNMTIPFGDYATHQFGANSEFWVSWRQRMDARYIAGYPAAGGDRIANAKQVIIAQGDLPGTEHSKPITGNACSEAEVVIVSSNPGSRPPYPTGYIECGRYVWFEQVLRPGMYAGNAGGSQVVTRQNMRKNGSGQFTCIGHPGDMDQSGCFTYRPDEWIAYMVHLKLGPDGRAVSSVSGKEQPGYVRSTFELYAAYQGEEFKLLQRQSDVVIPKGQYFVGGDPLQSTSYKSGWGPADAHPQAKFGKLWLLPYMTNKDANDASPKSSTWYDEVIVSRCRIAAPGYPPPHECNPVDTPEAPVESTSRPPAGPIGSTNDVTPKVPTTPPPPIVTGTGTSTSTSTSKSAGAAKMPLIGVLRNLPPGQWFEIPDSGLSKVLTDACKVRAVRNAYERVMPGLLGCNPENIMTYSGGAYDTKRHRLLVWGGGHSAYAGNELYAFDVREAKWLQLTEPTPPVLENVLDADRKKLQPQSPPWSDPDSPSGPISVHSYDQLEYLPDQDWLFAAGGSTYSVNGYASSLTWLFDLKKENASGWMQAQPMPGKVYRLVEYNMSSAYDPVSKKLLMRGYSEAGSFNPADKQWTVTQTKLPTRKLGTVGEIDPKRRAFVVIGLGSAELYRVSPTGELAPPQALGASGDTEIEQCYAPGFVFDTKAERLVAWCGKGDVYTLDLDKRVWTRHAPKSSVIPGDPANTKGIRGTFGRFRYMPEYNAYIVANGTHNNVFLYRLADDKGRIP